LQSPGRRPASSDEAHSDYTYTFQLSTWSRNIIKYCTNDKCPINNHKYVSNQQNSNVYVNF